MKKITVLIETGEDKTFNAFVKNEIPFGLLGEGITVKETIEDFLISYDEMRELFADEKKDFPEYKFIFRYDIESFLTHYGQIFTMSALENLTGINQKQLHHYKSGSKKPREAQVKKIENALHKLGSELIAVQL